MLRKLLSRGTKSRTLLTLGALLVVNAGVAHIVIAQITPRTPAAPKVLGTESVAPQGQVVSDATAPTDTGADHSKEITIYVVKSGDTISGIADQFNITTGTIYAANDLTKNQKLQIGQKLVILPITGIQYKVKSGDTISGISQKFDVPSADILDFNGIDDASKIKIGDKLIIPNADAGAVPPAAVSTPKPSTTGPKKTAPAKTTPVATAPTAPSPAAKDATTPADNTSATTDTSGATPEKTNNDSHGFIVPVPGSVLSQGLHDINAVDFAAPIGTDVVAAKGGTVIVAKGSGYNGGFGEFVVIDHGGVQTLYAHMSKVDVKVGDDVDQGDKIGEVGSTGKSTGPHTHFEVHGGKNPWAHNKVGTHY